MINNPAYKSNPLAWWRDISIERFPRLSYIVTDFLTILLISVETERTFSSTRLIISLLRGNLRYHIISKA